MSRSRHFNKNWWKKRLSNFLLWQLAYTELYFLDKLWPDFSSKDLKNTKRLLQN